MLHQIDRNKPKKLNKSKIMELRKKYETKPMDLYESVGTMPQDSPNKECDTNLSNQLCMDSFIYQIGFCISEHINTEKNQNIVYGQLLTQTDIMDIVKKDRCVYMGEGTFPEGYYKKLLQQTERFYDEYMV